MSSTTRIPKAEITGPYGYLLKRFSRKMLGEVPEGAAVMWHNRPVLMSLTGLGRKIQKWDQLDANLKSFANMAVAAQVGCSFCLDFGYFQAHNEGHDEVKASEVPRWRESTVFTPLEREVMEYAEAMTETPPRVTDELSARLLEQLGAPALVELTAVVGFRKPDREGQHRDGDRVPRVLQRVRAATGATLGGARDAGMSENAFARYGSLLFTVAYEMLGSATDAEDVVQETWLRWADVDHAVVRNPRAYLVRLVTRQALNRLRSVARRREDYVGEWLPEPLLTSPDVAADVELAESVSIAMLTVLETLGPAERAVFEATAVWLNGSPAIRLDIGGQVDTAVSLAVENGRITRLYAVLNAHKLARLHGVAALART
jgi:RNA polymerase sigma factor (sigma-70 family)